MKKVLLLSLSFTIVVTSFFAFHYSVRAEETSAGLPRIISISPISVNRNDIVEVSGENFGGVYTGEVVINGSRITDIEDWSDTKIRVAVRGFTGTGDLPFFIRSNQVGDGNLVDSNTVSLRILQKSPKILSITPNKVIPQGTQVEIIGQNFGATQATYDGKLVDIYPLPPNNIYGMGELQEIISWSDTRIKAKLNISGNVFDRINTHLQVRVKCLDSVCNNYESGLGLTNRPSDEYWSEGDVLSKIFIEAPTCTSWTYSAWNTCSANGQQTRTVNSASPSGCTGGNPTLSQSCTYIPPTPSCTSFYYSSWSKCSPEGEQTRSITSKYPYNCEGGELPKTTQSCTYTPPTPSCSADTWTCGVYGSCSLSGIQSRSCTKTFDCPNVQTAPPATDQYCEAPSRPTQQVPQDSSQIANQDTIIKATVKLICPLDENSASQGSGTVIDSRGTILTNKHVVNGTLGCLVGFVNDFSDEPYFGDRQIADISKISASEDIAILKLRNPQNRTLPYISIAKGNSNIRLGTNINIYGYPAKFGTNMTYTNGSFSGTSGSYLKTGAIIEHGNSGGGAYLNDGTFIGVPSAVIKGELNALGYILSINTVNGWLGNSSITYNNNSNNNFSRVSSILENIDLKKLGLLQLVILNENGTSNTAPAVVNPKATQTPKPLPLQPSGIQKKETIAANPKQEVGGDGNSATSTGTQLPKPSLLKRFFNWISNLF